jgi:hypothetical protein
MVKMLQDEEVVVDENLLVQIVLGEVLLVEVLLVEVLLVEVLLVEVLLGEVLLDEVLAGLASWECACCAQYTVEVALTSTPIWTSFLP